MLDGEPIDIDVMLENWQKVADSQKQKDNTK